MIDVLSTKWTRMGSKDPRRREPSIGKASRAVKWHDSLRKGRAMWPASEMGEAVKCRSCGRRRAAFATGQRQCKPCRRMAVREYQRRYRVSLAAEPATHSGRKNLRDAENLAICTRPGVTFRSRGFTPLRPLAGGFAPRGNVGRSCRPKDSMSRGPAGRQEPSCLRGCGPPRPIFARLANRRRQQRAFSISGAWPPDIFRHQRRRRRRDVAEPYSRRTA